MFTNAQAYQQAVREEMLRDSSIFIIGTDLFRRGGHFAQILGIGPEFGDRRVRDTPISEAAVVAAGVGAALCGLRPIVDLNFMDFSLGAMDEIINQAAKARYNLGAPVPLVIRASSGVTLFAAQHNNSMETMFAATPGLLVATPSAPADTKGLLKTALRGQDPVVFMMHKRLTGARGEVGGPDELVPFGQASTLRAGGDVTVITYSLMVNKALKAADVLASEGIDAEVIDLRTLVPLDYGAIEASVRKTGRAVVVTEAPRFCSFAAELAATIQESVFNYLDGPVLRVGAKHAPIAHSPAIFETVVPQPEDIARAARLVLAPPDA